MNDDPTEINHLEECLFVLTMVKKSIEIKTNKKVLWRLPRSFHPQEPAAL